MMSDPLNGEVERVGEMMMNGGAELDPKIQEALGRALKAHYEDLVNAPIPDRFLVLLAELEAKERSHGG
jgi:hypothetical protein